VAKRWSIIAMPDDVQEYGKGLDGDRRKLRAPGTLSTAAIPGGGHSRIYLIGSDRAFIENYRDIDELIAAINSLVVTGDVLTTLEIHCHACPESIDGLWITPKFPTDQVADQGQKLKAQIRWDDNCYIYLSGCNTGTYYDRIEIPFKGPIARRLAQSMLFDSPLPGGGLFHHHLIVYGSCGYLRGTRFLSDCDVSAEYFKDDIWHEPYQGSRDVKAGHPNDCWIPFKNGTW
jgi:hypothetical protein